MEQQLEIQLKRLSTKLQQLLKQNQLLQKENNTLQKENTSLKTELSQKKEMSVKMQQQLDVSKLNANSLDANEKQELKKRIDFYLTEIDKCIALVNE